MTDEAANNDQEEQSVNREAEATSKDSETPDLNELKPGERGAALIARYVKTLPPNPGVYRMLGEDGAVLYVGKARNLKKRVVNYTRPEAQSNRIARMIMNTAAMEFMVTDTETEALLLEANLIKRLKPHFNVLLRDDKSFPFILIRSDHEAPELTKHRGARRRNGDYFGPFASASAVNRTITAMQKAFLLRTCTDAVYKSRSRPCLLYQIKRCAGPCTGEISSEGYNQLVQDARNFLSGQSREIQATLAKQMEEAAEALEYETAAIIRDRIAALSHVQSHQGINPQQVEEADVFACYQDAGQTCIQVFFFRTFQNWGNRAYYPRADKSLSAGEVLDSFLAQFYDDKPAPKAILISHEIEGEALLGEALSTRMGHKVRVSTPKRGEKRQLVDHALTNAKEALGRKLADTASQSRLLQGVANAFDLTHPPQRIEIYDNSHIQGTNAVGAMVVAGPEGFLKNQYRKFNIKSEDLVPGDDYGMMREVFTRRFSRLIKEHGPRPERTQDAEDNGETPPWPDLVLIDGGMGQLHAVRDVMQELGLLDDVPLVGIAKGPERDAGREKFFQLGKQAFMLEERDPVLYYVQRLRDEAHRFAIGSHRARRKKAMVANPLDEIAGIGPTRKRALLRHFGSAKAVSRAGLADLQAVDGISAAIAQIIYDHFHETGE